MLRVREATEHDAAACAAIYAPYVTDSAISFELEPPSAAEMAARIASAHDWLVLEDDAGRVVGYAYAGLFAPRAAYRWATEVSVYLEPGFERRGGGRTLYETLLPRLASRGFRMAIAGMTLPNDASVGLHRAPRRPPPRARLPARRHLPPDRLQVRVLARRRLDAARADRRRRASRRAVPPRAPLPRMMGTRP